MLQQLRRLGWQFSCFEKSIHGSSSVAAKRFADTSALDAAAVGVATKHGQLGAEVVKVTRDPTIALWSDSAFDPASTQLQRVIPLSQLNSPPLQFWTKLEVCAA